MENSRETKRADCICAVLVLLVGPVRLLCRWIGWGNGCPTGALLIAAALLWFCQLRRRLLQTETRRNLCAGALLIVFWVLARTMKYEFCPDGHWLPRYLWYLYYVPQVFIVLLAFLTVLHVGKPCDQPVSRRWKLLYIPAALIVLGILTNDLHQLAFRFPAGTADWTVGSYTHGPLYFAALAWIGLLAAAMLAVALVRCAVSDARRRIWMPLLPLLAGVGYCALFFLSPDNVLLDMYKVPEMSCILYAAFVETLILARLIPSNDSYGDFWNASSIGAGIMDSGGTVRYRSERSVPVTVEQVRQAESGPVLLADGCVSLRSHAVRGGYGYWTKDISPIVRLNRELAGLGDVLAEENAMLDAENRLAGEQTRIQEQNRLYDGIAGSVREQLDKLDRLLASPPVEEEAFQRTMKQACLLNAYIKRRSNLLLLSHRSRSINSSELRLAVAESLEYVRLCGIAAHGIYSGEGMLPGGSVLLAYELFETVLEAAVPGADALLVSLGRDGARLTLRMELNAPREVPPEDCLRSKASVLGGTAEIERDGGTVWVSVSLPGGGEGG